MVFGPSFNRKVNNKNSESPQDLITEREFVDEVCERHAKPGEALYDASHDMELTGDQERVYLLLFVAI